MSGIVPPGKVIPSLPIREAKSSSKGIIVKRDISFVLVACAFALIAQPGIAGEWSSQPVASASVPYCPPGSKFCPAPGAAPESVIPIDTHFGMDASTGQVTAYKGGVHPNDVANPPMTGEKVIYVSPPINVENRYVPYPGAPQTNMVASTSYYADPMTTNPYAGMDQLAMPQSPSPRQVQARPAPAAQPRNDARVQSEVANKQTDRAVTESHAGGDKIPWWKGGWWRDSSDKTDYSGRDSEITQGDKVPWWKGGMWRNRKDDGSSDEDEDYAAPPSRSTASAGSSRSEDSWGNDEFTGYNPDGSVSQGAPAQSYGNASDPFNSPFYGGQPQTTYSNDPYMQSAPVAANGPMYAGEAYTLPNSPPPTSPYPDGYSYPGTTQSYDPYQTQSYGTTTTYTSPAPIYVDSSPVMASATSSPDAAFLPPPPSSSPAPRVSSAPPAADGKGSLQFENAVKMVKEGRFSEAKNLLTAETKSNPNHAASWRWLGDCYYNLLELDSAINTYQRALDRDPNDDYARRGQGFSYLHRGHEHWRRMQEEVARGQKDQAAATFSQAHENYKKALELLGFCLRRAPNDPEAVYGEAMAAEGASRKLYSNAISYLKLGPEQRERAELYAENCLTVINKGIERARERAKQNTGDPGPRALLAGMQLRKAILYHNLGKNDLALMELKNSRDVQQSILDEIDKNNATAIKNLKECEAYWEAWGGNRQ